MDQITSNLFDATLSKHKELNDRKLKYYGGKRGVSSGLALLTIMALWYPPSI